MIEAFIIINTTRNKIAMVSQKNNFHSLLFAVLCISALTTLLVPLAAHAQAIFFKAAQLTHRVGDSFQVSLLIDTHGQAINTVHGKVAVPTAWFELRDVRYGASIVSLWVEKPSFDYANGFINFTGGIPGGFSGSAGPLLSFVLKAKKRGSAEVSMTDISVLLNDGLGTAVNNVASAPLRLTIKEAPLPVIPPAPVKEAPAILPPPEVSVPPPDTVPPEDFIPLVSRHPSIGNDKYFVSFSTVDKDTGISHYDVYEKPFLIRLFTEQFNISSGPLQNPPYILQYQYWPTEIVVRAYDQAGNVREARTEKPVSQALVWSIASVLVLIVAYISYLVTKRGNIKVRKRAL